MGAPHYRRHHPHFNDPRTSEEQAVDAEAYKSAHTKLKDSIADLQAKLLTKPPATTNVDDQRRQWQHALGEMTHKMSPLQNPPFLGNRQSVGGVGQPVPWGQWSKQARSVKYFLRRLKDPAALLASISPEDRSKEVEAALVTLCEAYEAWSAKWTYYKSLLGIDNQKESAEAEESAEPPVLKWYHERVGKAPSDVTLGDASNRTSGSTGSQASGREQVTLVTTTRDPAPSSLQRSGDSPPPTVRLPPSLPTVNLPSHGDYSSGSVKGSFGPAAVDCTTQKTGRGSVVSTGGG